MNNFEAMYEGADELSEVIIEGDGIAATMPLTIDRNCELAVECWQLRRELHDKKITQKRNESFIIKLQKDVSRLTASNSTQRVESKEKDDYNFQLQSTILEMRTKITDLEVSNHGVTGTLRKRRIDLDKLTKLYDATKLEHEKNMEISNKKYAKLKTESSKTIKELKETLKITEIQLNKEKQNRINFEKESKFLKTEVDKFQTVVLEMNHKLTIELKELVSKQLHQEKCSELDDLKSVKAQLDTDHSELLDRHNRLTVKHAETEEHFNLVKTEFKLLLSQPQFRNIRVNSKISKILNSES